MICCLVKANGVQSGPGCEQNKLLELEGPSPLRLDVESEPR